MTAALPNPFIDSLSADGPPSVDQLTAHIDHAAVLSIRETPHGACQEVVASIGQAGAATSKSERPVEQPFFSIPLLPSAEITAELEAGIAAIVAGVARKRSHIAFRSFASNSAISKFVTT